MSEKDFDEQVRSKLTSEAYVMLAAEPEEVIVELRDHAAAHGAEKTIRRIEEWCDYYYYEEIYQDLDDYV